MERQWSKKQVWVFAGDKFRVEIVTWERFTQAACDKFANAGFGMDTGRHAWNVYCYIYPGHPAFKFLGDRDVEATYDWPFHGGATLFERNARDGVVISIQIGSDYSHYGDDRFSFSDKLEDNKQVMADAVELVEFLETFGDVGEEVQ